MTEQTNIAGEQTGRGLTFYMFHHAPEPSRAESPEPHIL